MAISVLGYDTDLTEHFVAVYVFLGVQRLYSALVTISVFSDLTVVTQSKLWQSLCFWVR